ncbi:MULTISPECIES: substrate-binding domain-containing protein [Methylovorus]|uniref:Extracellular solute-binding protein family 3 n=1 Tax=Methylovorus glucosotrophus (strain SIP3-4) TaxID=582744 RepID=C6XA48_METGS|nr:MULTISPECIES: substrate-binding domain-containing protein [Methylovorus]ACT51589.1 extracellular solute-binding protein family 3 [Methylovorus glucosotrophus SIP3-4]ADQ85451.1 extracellular solute-binding protein family 3 [Methylovorus sp. MP688]
MLINFKKVSLVLLFTALANSAFAADENTLEVDPNVGRGGEPSRIDDPTEFKVCADQDNLPYSNSKQEGFENKIAQLIAQDLGKKLSYQFWYDRMGYIRNTLNARRCDVIMGTVAGNDMVLTSKPYYRSGYVFVTRKESNLNITDWDSPDLRKGIIGVVGQTPPSRPIYDKGLMENARPYRIQRDLNLPPSFMIDDLVKGDIDIAIVWGPIGGYYAKQSKVPLVVVPVPEYEDTNVHGKEYWNISVAVRKKDKERLAMIQEVLDRRHADIMKILDDFGIPHLDVVPGDSVEKKRETRGDVIPKFE